MAEAKFLGTEERGWRFLFQWLCAQLMHSDTSLSPGVLSLSRLRLFHSSQKPGFPHPFLVFLSLPSFLQLTLCVRKKQSDSLGRLETTAAPQRVGAVC